MNILDIIILICLIPALIQGLRKGFISQAIAIVSIIVGVWASAQFANALGAWLAEYITASAQTLKIISFALILVASFLALGFLARLVEGLLDLVMLGWVNNLLGAAFSLVKCILILALVFMLVNSMNASMNLFSDQIFSNSTLYPIVEGTSQAIFPYIESLFTAK